MSSWGDGAEGWLEPRINCTEVQATFRDVAPDTVAAAEDVRTKRNAPTRTTWTDNVYCSITDLNMAGAANQAGVSKRAPSDLTAS